MVATMVNRCEFVVSVISMPLVIHVKEDEHARGVRRPGDLSVLLREGHVGTLS